jgi:catechol 2,3-dioxygenase-like lactoylglutathione lyase family enzyme
MSGVISTQGVHHVTLTVLDVERSVRFYSELFNFQKITDFGSRAIMSNGSVLLALSPPPDPAQAIPEDRFNENRIGLDHVSFSVASMADLEAAIKLLDAHGIQHGDINPLTPFGIAIMALRDPDNIQIELTAPLT